MTKNKSISRTWWIVGLALFIFALAGCLYLHNKCQSANEYISIIGSVASAAGIVVAIIQIHELGSRTGAIENAVNEAKKQMENLSIFADVNKHSQFINEIEAYIRSDKYEQALITYKELKERLNLLLGYVENRNDLSEMHSQLKKLIDTAGGDVSTLNEMVLNSRGYTLDKLQISKNLEEIKTFLDQYSGKLKSRRDDRRTNR